MLRVTASAICGSDLHLYRGIVPGMKEGDILGHEFMGIVEDELETVLTTMKVEGGRGFVLRQMIACTRRGGHLSVPGVYAGWIHVARERGKDRIASLCLRNLQEELATENALVALTEGIPGKSHRADGAKRKASTVE